MGPKVDLPRQTQRREKEQKIGKHMKNKTNKKDDIQKKALLGQGLGQKRSSSSSHSLVVLVQLRRHRNKFPCDFTCIHRKRFPCDFNRWCTLLCLNLVHNLMLLLERNEACVVVCGVVLFKIFVPDAPRTPLRQPKILVFFVPPRLGSRPVV